MAENNTFPQETVTISTDEYRDLLFDSLRLDLLAQKRINDIKTATFVRLSDEDFILGHYVVSAVNARIKELGEQNKIFVDSKEVME